MPLLENQLYTKSSTLPGAGKGLFTKNLIKKGTRIVEYKGKVTTWKEVVNAGTFNAYVYYIKRSHVIDAKNYMKAIARFANDARGLTRKKGISNNAFYVLDDGRVYIEAAKNIQADEEIFVAYGKDYWDVIKSNIRIEEEEKLKNN